MWVEDCRWHYDYVRLAWDSGFSFDKQKQPNLDKNKICLIDIDRVVKERDVACVEQYLSIVIGYVLDSEQAEILDSNFVKVFRMSQLAVEYLLFCKRYLDNTVVLLKKDMGKAKEEIKELKSYIQDLENNLSQMQKHTLTNTFKCNKCLKVFSSDDYLNSHIKRRHNDHSQISNKADKIRETNQLESEIKELNERLNVTEKMLKDKIAEVEMKENKAKGEKVREFYSNFDQFKQQVENEISILQTEKKIDEDKYNRLFELVRQMNNTESQMLLARKKSDTSHTSSVDEVKKKTGLDTVTSEDNTSDCKKTEPDHSKLKILDVVSIQDNYYGNKEDGKSTKSDDEVDKKLGQEFDDQIDRKISEMSSNLEFKISASLSTIQTQMESFWSKLSEMQVNNQESAKSKPTSSSLTNREEIEDKSATESSHLEEISTMKPKIKPRTKFSYPTKVPDDSEIPSAAEKLKSQLDHYMSHQENIGVRFKPLMDDYTPHQGDVEDLKTQKVLQQSPTIIKNVQSKVQVFPKESELKQETITEKLSSESSESSTDRHLPTEEKISAVQERLQEFIGSKLEDIGVSSDWKGIPKKSFEERLDIIKHQANMSKKRYCNYSSVRKSIEKTLNMGASKGKLSRRNKLKAPPTETQIKLSNLMKTRCRKKTKQLAEPKSIEIIKQQEPYQTDSESDHLGVHEDIKVNQGEFKVFPLKSTLDLLQNTDSDLQSVSSLADKIDEIQTKTNSTDLVGKKKVAFNVTPSDAGSVQLDEKQRNDGSLSDFDLSLL